MAHSKKKTTPHQPIGDIPPAWERRAHERLIQQLQRDPKFRRGLKRGLADAEAGRTMTLEELKRTR